MNKSYFDNYNIWLTSDYIDKKDKEELLTIQNNTKEIEERFYKDLSFGTGGMRGIRGVGTNRINKYTIRKATQGLADYILSFPKDLYKNGVAIAYDCRLDSEELALNTALVLAGNGIKTHLFSTLHSTPELSFAVRELKCIAGVVITASHNPKEYNGYKVYWNDGGQIVEPQASEIVNCVNNIKSFSLIKMETKEIAIKNNLLTYISDEMDTKFINAVKKQIIHKNISGKQDFKIVYSPLHGTGGRPIKRVLSETGFNSVYIVPEQEKPDGNFPTCSYANPEDSTVFKLSIALAEKVDAKLCMANDPDADRVGIAIKNNNDEWIYPNGNQIGLLLIDYILQNKKNIPKNSAIISTIASTPMLDIIAKKYNIKVFRTLTGFKYIGEKIREFENNIYNFSFLMGFEESYGYLIGTHSRDKDAVVSSLLIAEMGAYYDSIGSSLNAQLENLSKEFGFYREGIVAISKKGKDGVTAINKIMNGLRTFNSEKLFDRKIKHKIDYSLGYKDIPKSNVIQFILDDNTYITARPSGTEPKIKYYFCVSDTTEQKVNKKLNSIISLFTKFIDEL